MKRTIALFASILVSTAAFAQVTPAPAVPAAHAKASAKPSATDRVEKHIKRLHDQLKISAGQEAQWGSVAQTMRDNATQLDAVIQKREEDTSVSALDNLNSYAEVTQAQSDGVKKLSAVFTPLYNSMSDDQKKNADAVFSHGRNRHAVHNKNPASKG